MIPADRNILTAALLLNAAATQTEQARRHLSAEIRLCDGLPTSTFGAQRVGGGGRGPTTMRVPITDENGDWIDGERAYDEVPATSVEMAAIQRQHLQEQRDDLNALCRGIVTMANELSATCRRILGIRIEVPRCSATGRDGAIEWHDPSCTNVPSRGTLCEKHSKSEWRWRTLHGLPPRTDGVFSGGPAA